MRSRSDPPKQAPVEALYEQLPCGRRGAGGLSRAQVAADQRRRLQGAMIEAVARHGYAATTVSEVVALAGVSKKTLYKHFAGKQECFLATFDAIVEDGVERISSAYREGGAGERDWAQGLCRAFDAFVGEIAARPQAAWLALVEVLAAGPGALTRIEGGEAVFARMIEQSLARGPGGVALPPVLLRGIVHGLWYVARTRLLERRPAAMADSGPELLRWVLAYRSPASVTLEGSRAHRKLASSARCSSPAGSRIEGDERTRLLGAAGEIAAAGGFQTLTGAQIAQEADVAEERFHELFESPEECFLAYLELGSAQALARALRAARDVPDWPVAVCVVVESLLRYVACDPVFARASFVEIFATGPAGVQRRAALMGAFADVLARRTPRSLSPGSVAAQAITGAVWGMVHHEVVHDRARMLPDLSAHAAYVALAPLIGGEAALGAIGAAALL